MFLQATRGQKARLENIEMAYVNVAGSSAEARLSEEEGDDQEPEEEGDDQEPEEGGDYEEPEEGGDYEEPEDDL